MIEARKTTLAEIRACAREGLSLRAAALRLGIPYATLRLRALLIGVSFRRHNSRELQGGMLNESLRGVTLFRPDPPAERRGAVNVTAEFCGDPPPGRREELERRRASESRSTREEAWS